MLCQHQAHYRLAGSTDTRQMSRDVQTTTEVKMCDRQHITTTVLLFVTSYARLRFRTELKMARNWLDRLADLKIIRPLSSPWPNSNKEGWWLAFKKELIIIKIYSRVAVRCMMHASLQPKSKCYKRYNVFSCKLLSYDYTLRDVFFIHIGN